LKKEVKIDRIDGISLLKDGVKAYDYAVEQSKKGKAISLGIYQTIETISVSNCKIPERQAILKISNDR
jgi:hypothetical protein